MRMCVLARTTTVFLTILMVACASSPGPVPVSVPVSVPGPVAVAPAPSTAASVPVSTEPFEPTVGQAGKDVVWVPTSPALLERMLDMAKLTADDYVMDLGSGDGRNVIAAAKRGARARGVEYNPDMVALSRRAAAEAGVADRATFVEGDMYAADISQATVMALFLLPVNLDRLKDKFLALTPGSRIVMNTFTVSGWEADEQSRIETDCQSWCTSLLYIVPARAAGTWRVDNGGTVVLAQEFQMLTGTFTNTAGSATPVTGRLRGRDLTISVGASTFRGTVENDRITGSLTESTGTTSPMSAIRVAQ